MPLTMEFHNVMNQSKCDVLMDLKWFMSSKLKSRENSFCSSLGSGYENIKVTILYMS